MTDHPARPDAAEDPARPLERPRHAALVRRNWNPGRPAPSRIIVCALPFDDSVDRVVRALSLLGLQALPLLREGGTAAAWARDINVRPGIVSGVAIAPAQLPAALDSLKDAALIAIDEDATATALAIEALGGRSIETALGEAVESRAAMLRFLCATHHPCILASAGGLLGRPQALVEAIILLAALVPSAAQVLAACERLDVRTPRFELVGAPQPRVQGALNREQEAGLIRGWAKRALSGERLLVHVRLSGERIADGLADQPRKDLRKHSIGDGQHGFAVNVGPWLQDTAQVFEVWCDAPLTLLGSVSMSRTEAERLG